MLSPHFMWYKASLPLPIAETGKWRLRAIKQPAQGKAAHTLHALSLPLAARPPSPQPEVAAPFHGATLSMVQCGCWCLAALTASHLYSPCVGWDECLRSHFADGGTEALRSNTTARAPRS